MKKIFLSPGGLEVSVLALGTAQYGTGREFPGYGSGLWGLGMCGEGLQRAGDRPLAVFPEKELSGRYLHKRLSSAA